MNVRVAWSTGSWAGAGSAELAQSTGEQVDVLEKCHGWKEISKVNEVLQPSNTTNSTRAGDLLTVAGKPLRFINARRQRCEGKHVHVCDALAHVLLLQIGTLLQIIVINSPWEDNEAEDRKRRDGKTGNIAV